MRKGKFSILLVLILIAAMSSVTVFAAPRLPSGPTYKEVKVATVEDGGKPFDLRTNIYLPKNQSTEPTPLVLFIHGNGGAYNFSNGSRSYELSIALTDKGIAVATIDYRPGTSVPENLYDVKAYVRFFRAHAKAYNIDPNRIGIWGTSRGGHLAALLETTGDVKELEGDVGGNLDQSSRVQCSVIFYPLTDLLSDGKFPVSFFGLKDADAAAIAEADKKNDTSSPYWKYVQIARLTNPLNYVTKDDPPALVAVSALDPVTPMKLSWELFNKLVEAGVDASFYAWSKGAHGIVGTDIEAAASEWIANKLLVELAPSK